jgi:putative transport protein
VVTNKAILGKSLRELDLPAVCGVIVSRVTRADIEMTAVPALQLQFGDMLQVVGDEESLDKAAKLIGNSVKELSHTNLIPIFIGIALGVLVGLYPFKVGNIPVPVRLGLAGGPLVVAILLSRIGRIGPLVWHMPVNANILLRELGIVLFLTCVGLRAGEKYFEVLFSADGCLWLACGVAITLLPILVVAFIGRIFLKLNFVHLCGVLAGSMTDPPALAFANSFNNSDAPSVAYATVYPLTMILRIIVAQLLVLFWLR